MDAESFYSTLPIVSPLQSITVGMALSPLGLPTVFMQTADAC